MNAFHQDMLAKIVPSNLHRGAWDEILGWSGPDRSTVVAAQSILIFFRPCLVDEYVDFDRKGRGDSLNHDLYAYCPSQGVAIVQARHAFRRFKNGYLNVHKTYFLVGYNELTGAPFRHPVSATAVRAAVRKHGSDQCSVIKAVQAWMFRVTLKQLEASTRQGDVLATPVRVRPDGLIPVQGIEARVDSHIVWGLSVATDPTDSTVLWVQNPVLTHERDQHEPVMLEGSYRVTLARESRAWNFATRLGD